MKQSDVRLTKRNKYPNFSGFSWISCGHKGYFIFGNGLIQITISKRILLILIATLLIGGSMLAINRQAFPLQAQRSPLPAPTRGPISATLETILLSDAERYQVIQFNPGAALQKVIFAHGFVPNSSEFTFQYAGTNYMAQRAEELAKGEVRVYFVAEGDWDNVRYAVRP